MKRARSHSLPTPAELEILQVLWSRGKSSVREIHDAFGAEKGIGYTTVLKLLQIMFAKGLVRREEAGKAHLYEAVQPAAKAQGNMVSDMVQRVFGGSSKDLVMRAMSEKTLSREELAEIRKMLDELESEAK